ncbi:hypothetical protein [Zhaonella formicivorans]|jgi:rubrerythrin|uniref:hypothetical protein n=1 Tax=Zhaonella formicivorans TaxID=2528593 RepID=UPI001D11A66E|nr:hypothetical protein [Zhaonella formicivorans]
MDIINMPDNSSQGFKCGKCGHMFTVKGKEGNCPVCGYHCNPHICTVVDTSDEEY